MELQAPLIPHADNTGIENFMRGFALVAANNAKRAQTEAAVQRMALQNEALQQHTELQREKFGLDAQQMQNLNDYRSQGIDLQRQKLEMMGQHSGQLQDIAERTLDARNAELKLREQRIVSDLEDQRAKIWGQRKGLFNKELQQYGLPVDALENPDAWKRGPDGKLSLELSVRDSTGAPQYSKSQTVPDPVTGKPVPAPITVIKRIDPDTLKRLRATKADLDGSQPTPRMVPQEQAPEIVPAPADPTAREAGKLYSTPKGNFQWDGSGWAAPE